MTRAEKIAELEYLAGQLARLLEAEWLLAPSKPEMGAELRRLIAELLDQFIQTGRQVFTRSPRLAGRRPSEPTLERLERAFVFLRDTAEGAWLYSHRLEGRESKKARVQADEIAKLTRLAAAELQQAAERVGRWNLEYADELEMGPWL